MCFLRPGDELSRRLEISAAFGWYAYELMHVWDDFRQAFVGLAVALQFALK